MEVSIIWSSHRSCLLSRPIVIITDRVRERLHKDQNWVENEDIRLNPESIAKVITTSSYSFHRVGTDAFGQSYLYLANQDRSAWTWELDLRPAHENW